MTAREVLAALFVTALLALWSLMLATGRAARLVLRFEP